MVETFSRKIIRIGDSLGILLPNEIVGRYKLKERDKININLEIENMEKEMSRGFFRLGKTYYRNGFFNTNKSFPRFVAPDDFGDVKITLYLESKSKKIKAIIKYKGHNGKGKWINNTHKPRIFGGKELGGWFQGNFKEGDYVEIVQSSDSEYLLKKGGQN